MTFPFPSISPVAASGPTPPAFVNIGAVASITAEALELTLPASIVAGNVLIAVTSIVSTRNPVWPAGWTAIGAGFAAYRIASGSDTNPTVTWTGSSLQLGWITQWTPGAGVGATEDNQAQSGTTASAAAITTTAANSLVVAIVLSGSNTIPSTSSGFTSRATDSNPGSIRVADETVVTSGTDSDPISSTVTSAIWRALLVELKGA
jgi:hypothetical protein